MPFGSFGVCVNTFDTPPLGAINLFLAYSLFTSVNFRVFIFHFILSFHAHNLILFSSSFFLFLLFACLFFLIYSFLCYPFLLFSLKTLVPHPPSKNSFF